MTRHAIPISVNLVHVQLHRFCVFALPSPLINADISILVEGFIVLLDHVSPGGILLQGFSTDT